MNGEGIDSWLFNFIAHDQEFQSVLFRAAEEVKNWQFLENLSDYRAELKRENLAKQPLKTVHARGFRHRANRSKPFYEPRPAKKGHQTPQKPTRTLSPLKPQDLPSHIVMRVPSNAFTHCPRCKLRLLKKVLTDHLELACPNRGQVDAKSGNARLTPWRGPSYEVHWNPW